MYSPPAGLVMQPALLGRPPAHPFVQLVNLPKIHVFHLEAHISTHPALCLVLSHSRTMLKAHCIQLQPNKLISLVFVTQYFAWCLILTYIWVYALQNVL